MLRCVARRYKYQEEPFSVRRKDFWPLCHANKVLQMISQLSHEADGLILQVSASAMVQGESRTLVLLRLPSAHWFGVVSWAHIQVI